MKALMSALGTYTEVHARKEKRERRLSSMDLGTPLFTPISVVPVVLTNLEVFSLEGERGKLVKPGSG